MAKPKANPSAALTPPWQEWAKKRAQQALPLERIHEISKKVPISITQILLEERQGQ